jgi:hypothetical protein
MSQQKYVNITTVLGPLIIKLGIYVTIYCVLIPITLLGAQCLKI